MSRVFSPAMIIAGISMAFIVVFSNWLMQGGPPHPEFGYPLPQPFGWLNNITGQNRDYGVFIFGQFTFPIAFLITDIINRLYGPDKAGQIITVGVIFGGLASVYFAGPQIALGSIVAFTVGQVLDVLIFQRLRTMDWYIAPLASSLLASLIDTVLFYVIALGVVDLMTYGPVDFGVKVFVAIVALLPFRLLIALWIGDRQPA